MSKLFTLASWGSFLLAILLWAGYGYLIIKLADERTLFSATEVEAIQSAERNAASSRLHSLIRDVKSEQELLEELARTDVLTAVKTIEAAGKSAGAKVTVSNATASQLVNKANSQSVKDLRSVTVTVNGEGSFQSLIRAAKLLEALPFIASVQNLQFEELPLSADGKRRGDAWRMSVGMRIITTSPGI
ncbi:MAG: hypothetical protein G01um10148_144 [Parcubacteria group bacterium Gr01-1014_8]|nr:MAG: hypothetical protein G01um10148_144 [Parcubacteria group bacterium Gr01-1014_8]